MDSDILWQMLRFHRPLSVSHAHKSAINLRTWYWITLSNIASHLVQARLHFLMVPFFMRTLGKEQYGIWILIASVFAYRNTKLGLNSAINRLFPCSYKNDDAGSRRSSARPFCIFIYCGRAGRGYLVYTAMSTVCFPSRRRLLELRKSGF